MSHERPEISRWLRKSGHTVGEIERILGQLDRFDDLASRESLFDDLANGEFDIRPVIEEARRDDSCILWEPMQRDEDVFLQGGFRV